ncbi:DUF6542 domain-containing protein [Corynebacterium kozikiae]|uniref:DUF6542 domain-containing protein n=1 Tax=Corynebacterium kozikiae TaxID=2968469 RepID=UPI00211C8E18|nr:hypothetical protein [Corynebacterium sp. 76QC2CO]
MSQAFPRKRARSHAANGPFYGFSLWTAYTALLIALAVGTLFSVYAGTISTFHLVLFVVFALVFALITEPKALFLFVAALPFWFSLSVLAAGFIVVMSSGNAFGRTQLVTSIYPLTQHFPWMALTTLAAAALAFGRVGLLRRQQRNSAARAERAREHQQRSNDVLQQAATKSRTQAQRSRTSGSVTVEELLARNPRRNRRSSLDSPETRGARTYAPKPSAKPVQAPKPATPQPVTPQPAQNKGPRRFSEDLYAED